MPTFNESIIEYAALTWFGELGCSRSTFRFTLSFIQRKLPYGEGFGQPTGQATGQELDKLGLPLVRALARLVGFKPCIIKGY